MLKIFKEGLFLIGIMAASVAAIVLFLSPMFLGLTLKDCGYPDWVAFPSMPLSYLVLFVLGRVTGMLGPLGPIFVE